MSSASRVRDALGTFLRRATIRRILFLAVLAMATLIASVMNGPLVRRGLKVILSNGMFSCRAQGGSRSAGCREMAVMSMLTRSERLPTDE
jgi:hypothetical protein